MFWRGSEVLQGGASCEVHAPCVRQHNRFGPANHHQTQSDGCVGRHKWIFVHRPRPLSLGMCSYDGCVTPVVV